VITVDLKDVPVLWISMQNSHRKKTMMKKMFSSFGFKKVKRIEAINAKKHNLSHHVALIKSYQRAFQHAPKDNFIILEDDCVPRRIATKIKIPTDTDCFYLGLSKFGVGDSGGGEWGTYSVEKENELYRIKNMLAAHAIYYRTNAWKNACRQSLIESLENDVPLDIGYVSIQPKYKVYCGNPIFYQSGYNYRATNFILD
tara:strand:- start:477 stop:1073 length:597 start_codon:yes stop_codon:yes gene_type:complete